MTKTHAADIHTKWKQQREPLCEHPIQEFVRLARSDDGVLLGTYHCRDCGEAIVYTHNLPPSPLMEVIMRPEIMEFKHICDNLLGSAQQNDWTLTEKERKVVAYYIQELGNRVIPASQEDHDQPFAMPLGALPPIID